jgi:hypothetical protein
MRYLYVINPSDGTNNKVMFSHNLTASLVTRHRPFGQLDNEMLSREMLRTLRDKRSVLSLSCQRTEEAAHSPQKTC